MCFSRIVCCVEFHCIVEIQTILGIGEIFTSTQRHSVCFMPADYIKKRTFIIFKQFRYEKFVAPDIDVALFHNSVEFFENLEVESVCDIVLDKAIEHISNTFFFKHPSACCVRDVIWRVDDNEVNTIVGDIFDRFV